MLYSEFHALTNIKCSSDVYDKIQEIYCYAINLDKRAFCAHYKQIHNNPLLKTTYEKWKEFEQRYTASVRDIKHLHEVIKKVYDQNNELKAQVFQLQREIRDLQKKAKSSTSKKQ